MLMTKVTISLGFFRGQIYTQFRYCYTGTIGLILTGENSFRLFRIFISDLGQ